MIDFTRPQFLGLLVLLVPTVWVHYHTYTALSPARRRLSLLLRVVLLVLLAVTAAGVRWDRRLENQCVVFVLDRSFSVEPAALDRARAWVDQALDGLPAGDVSGVVLFGAVPVIEKAPGRPARAVERQRTLPDGTDLAAALQVAGSLTPAGYGTRLVLLTDGRENAGNALREAEALLADGIDLDLVALPAGGGNEAALESLELPRAAKKDQPFLARLVIHSDVEQELRLTVKRNRQLIGTFAYRHPGSGARLVTMPMRAEAEGFVHYQFQLEADTDTIRQNNEQEAFLEVAGPPRVLLVASNPAAVDGIAQVLRDARYQVEVRHPGEVTPSLADLRGYDAVLVADVTAMELGERTMSALKSHVRELGGGLLMVGGPNSFGAGGFYQTPVEEVLPVTMDLRNRREMPQSAVVLAIDKSGSMSMMMDGLEKIEIAKKAAVMTLELMGPNDYVGVIGFDGAGKAIVPFELLQDPAGAIDEIGSIRAGGGTDICPALEMARGWLEGIPRMNKHIILLSDGCTTDGDYERMAREMHANGITLTTVAIGVDANKQLMEALAASGGGRYYIANDLAEIPRIFTRETLLTVKNVISEKPFRPAPGSPGEIVRGLPAGGLPALGGYVLTSPKPRAEVELLAPEGDPLLATIRSGLGKTVAWTSDASGRWASSWLGSPVYPTFWEQAVRWALPELVPGNVSSTIQHDGNRVVVDLEVRDDAGGFGNLRDLSLAAAGPRGEFIRGELRQRGPGRYTGELELPARGSYLLTVVEHSGDSQRALLRTGIGHTYSPEYQPRQDDPGILPKLRRLAGVREVSKVMEVYRPVRQTGHRVVDIWQPLVLLAVILFIFDIAVRRVDFRLAEIVAWFRGRAPSPAAVRAAVTVDRLRRVRQSALPARPQLERPRPFTRAVPPAASPVEPEPPAAPAAPPSPDRPATSTSRLLDAKRRARGKLDQKNRD